MRFGKLTNLVFLLLLAAFLRGGAILLAGGTKGKRYALQHAKVMIHQPWGGVEGQISDIEIQANEIVKDRAVLNEILAEATGKNADQIAKDVDRDYYLSAEEAKAYGLVDNILTKAPTIDEQPK